MNPASQRLDRLADRALHALGLFNLGLVALFFLVMAGMAPAVAQPACSGADMLAAMQREDPARLEAIRSEAAATANGSGLLWRIEGAAAGPSWLFGTMHMADPRVVALPQATQAAFDAARTVVIESTDILDDATMAAALLADPELTMFTDDTTLRSLIDPSDLAMVEEELGRRGIPLSAVNKMKPWMVAATVALPACELARIRGGERVLDQRLAVDAQADGKEVGGLETVADQLGAMASLPMDFHVEGLVETLRIGDRIDDVMETMVQIYLDGETGLFWPFFRVALPAATPTGSAFADFEETMITARNRHMAERSVPFIEEGGAFIAVGALHLPGEDGLVQQLRDAGYAVERVE